MSRLGLLCIAIFFGFFAGVGNKQQNTTRKDDLTLWRALNADPEEDQEL